MRTVGLVMVTMLLALGAGLSPVTAAEDHVMVTPDELQWVDPPSLPPGAKLAVIQGPIDQATPFIIRVKFPAEYQVPAHWHPTTEHVTVLSGTFHMGLGDQLDPSKTQALAAGSISIMPAKTNHFAWTQEETVVQVHGTGPFAITYVDSANDPRKK